jgi:site-specific recombinase XerD
VLRTFVHLLSIQKLLGHAWLETTQTYVAANDRQVQADYDAASRKLEGWQ